MRRSLSRSLAAPTAPALLAGLLLLPTGCGDPTTGGEIDADTGAPDTGGQDAALDPIEEPVEETTEDALPPFDATPEVDTGPEGAALGEPCVEDEDCASELCVDLLPGEGGELCTQYCAEDTGCPDAFSCVLIGGSGGDRERLCLPDDLCLDPDGDGYGFGPDCSGPDCDETDALRSPGAEELCDGLDNNCNERVDENPAGIGEPCVTPFPGECAAGISRCGVLGIECAALRAPTDELCDGLDNNCDGNADEELPVLTFWIDADGDGFGDPDGESRSGCARPLGFVENTTDCDDSDGDVFPGAPEVPGDGVDSNCDDLEVCFGDADNDGYRTEDLVTTAVLDCIGDGLAAASVPGGDCRDRDAAFNPGARELPGDEVDQNCDGFELCWADGDLDLARGLSVVGSLDLDCRDPGEAVTSQSVDCDDLEVRSFPGNAEVCDDVDNDCDGRIDDGIGCYSLGDPCIDGRDCESGFCVGNECVDGFGCIVPGSCPSRAGCGGGAWVAPAELPTSRVVVGMPLASSGVALGDGRAVLGLVAYTAEPRDLR